MTKSEYPALRMKIERGHLVPAGPFDAERLDSYRNGAIVMCRFTEERDRVLVKKWFAIIGLVLKTCDTPWKNKDEAHEAIKLALGIVNLSKTVGGQYMQYPKSLSDLDDPEMTEALENMTALLSHMTGVDVETLRKETAHVDEEHADPETGEIIEHETTESGPSAPEEPVSAEDGAPTVSAASDDAAPSPSSDASHYEWLLNITKMLWGATNPGGELSVLVNQKKAALASHPTPADLPNLVRGKAEAVYGYAKQIITRDIDQQDGLALIAGVVGVDQDNIGRVA
jgi:hypothetical protein